MTFGDLHFDRRWWPLGAAVALIGLGLAANAALIDGVLERGDLAAFDPAVTTRVISQRSAVLTPVAQFLTYAASTRPMLVLVAAITFWFLLRRRWGAAALLAGSMALSVTLTLLLKRVIGRARPPVVDVLGPVNTDFAYPSGHTLNSFVFLGVVGGLAVWGLARPATRLLAVAACALAALGVGLSRIYLGYHWLTDILGGWSTGLVVLGLALLATTAWRRRKGAGSGDQHPISRPQEALRLGSGTMVHDGSGPRDGRGGR